MILFLPLALLTTVTPGRTANYPCGQFQQKPKLVILSDPQGMHT